MSRLFSLWVLLGFAFFCVHSRARAAATETVDPRADVSAAVLGLERAAGTDLVYLRNGDKLSGTVLNAAFSLRTAYGLVEFESRVLAGIDLAKSFEVWESVLTVNHNRFSGFLQETNLLFRLESGADLRLRLGAIEKIIFRMRPEETKDLPHGQFIALRNGDFFTGRLAAGPLVITTEYAEVPIAPERLQSFVPGGSAGTPARAMLSNGDILQGQLRTQDLEVQLDLGQSVILFRDRILVLYGEAGFRPASLKLPGSGGGGAPPAPGPRSQNAVSQLKRMVAISPGEFLMGSPPQEADRDLDEGPQATQKIPQPFWMGMFEVTQGEFEEIMGRNPSHFSGDPNRPVEKVSWDEAMAYCERLSLLAKEAGELPDGYIYRLPTEVEWEFTCRAGSKTRFSFGDDPVYTTLAEYGWFARNSSANSHPVGAKQPNAWGLYDMHGNVWEWCLDRWDPAASPSGGGADASKRESALRVARGGSWLYEGKFCRSSNRDDYGSSNRCSDVGFRVVLAPDVAP